VPTLIAPALGPVIGGLLVDGLSWRWIFYLNLPVGVAALVFGALFLPRGSEHPPDPFDLPGFLLAGTGFPLFMFALSTGATSGWGAAAVLATGVAGLALLALFVLVELRALLQNGLGFSAVHSGLATFPEAIGGMVGVQATSRLYKRVGPRRLMTAGMCGTVVSIGGMAFAGPGNAAWLIPVLMFFTGGSFGFAFSPSQAAALVTVSAAETGHASTLLNTLRQAGGAAGVALLGTVLGATGASSADLAGYRLAFLAAAGLMLLGAGFSSLVSDADAAPTMAEAITLAA